MAFGELCKGVDKSGRPEQNRRAVDRLLAQAALLLPDSATAEVCGRLAAALERAGQPIPENDVWIAAVAVELGLPLATRDAHFQRVPNLVVVMC